MADCKKHRSQCDDQYAERLSEQRVTSRGRYKAQDHPYLNCVRWLSRPQVQCDGNVPCACCVRSKIECIYTANKRTKLLPGSSPGEHAVTREPDLSASIAAVGADGMGGKGAGEREEGESTIYGPAAALHFLEVLQRTVTANDTSQKGPRSTSNESQTSLYLTPMPEHELFSLPARHIADVAIDAFLRYGLDVLPVLHAPSFRKLYASIWQSARAPDPSVYALVNICLALGTRFGRRSEINTEDESAAFAIAELFYFRARQLISNDALERSSLQTVQTLLLMVQYSQASYSATRTWNLLGLAIRHALAIGLQFEKCLGQNPDQILLEQRKRVWYACANLDAVSSMSFGRESLLKGLSVTISKPSAIDDDLITAASVKVQPQGAISRRAVFVHSVGLYAILSRLISELYPVVNGPTGEKAQTDALQKMLAFESDLKEWQASLPPALSFAPSLETLEPWVERHRNILRSRYLNVRILLFRPALKLLPPLVDFGSPSAPFVDAVVRLGAQQCIEAARQQIQMCFTASERQSSGAWWYTSFYCYTACSVLLAAQWQNLEVEDFDAIWQQGISLLQNTGRSELATALNAVAERLTAQMVSSADLLAELQDVLGSGWMDFDATTFDFASSSGLAW